MTQAVTDTKRADGGSIWLDLKAESDEADAVQNNSGYENDLAVLNLGADIRLGESFFGVVYTYARADTESKLRSSALRLSASAISADSIWRFLRVGSMFRATPT